MMKLTKTVDRRRRLMLTRTTKTIAIETTPTLIAVITVTLVATAASDLTQKVAPSSCNNSCVPSGHTATQLLLYLYIYLQTVHCHMYGPVQFKHDSWQTWQVDAVSL